MRSKRLSVEVGCFARDPEREEVWQPVPASKRNTADMLAQYSAGILIKGYRAYLRGDYVDSRRFAQFMERGKQKQVQICQPENGQNHVQGISRLRRMESRYQWALTIRENVSHFILNMTGLSGNCRLRKEASRAPARSARPRGLSGGHHANQERLSA
jgi:hypothetical protein